jgi:hypothetical protein
MQQRAPAEFKRCSKAGQQMGSKVDLLRQLHKVFARATRMVATSYSVRLEDSPWLPFSGELPHMIRTLLNRGERRIVLDLAGVLRIDAAGFVGRIVDRYSLSSIRADALSVRKERSRSAVPARHVEMRSPRDNDRGLTAGFRQAPSPDEVSGALYQMPQNLMPECRSGV